MPYLNSFPFLKKTICFKIIRKEQSTLSPIQSRDCVSPASHCYSSVPGSSELAALVHDGTCSYIAVWDLTNPVPQSLFKITGKA